MNIFQRQVAVSSAFAALLLTGCNVGPKYTRPAATAANVTAPPVAYKENSPDQTQTPTPAKPTITGNNEWQPAAPQDAMLHGKWWEIYGDTELNTLEDQLNINNQTIKQYFENFMAARTLIAQARSQLYPTVSVGPSFQRSRSSGTLNNAAIANVGKEASITTLPATVSWEPDLWGKVRNAIKQEQYNAQLTDADLENERLIEQADLAVFFFEVRGQDALIDILTKTVDQDQQSLNYAQAQYDTGVGTKISVVEAQNTLQTVQASLTNLGVARAQYTHAIAVLTGANPSAFSIPVKPMLRTAPPIPIGVPSQLLERRPDIAAAERTMAAANAQVGIAYAAFYPTLTLGASGGFESTDISRIFDWPSRIWSIGPTASETVFDGGLRRAEVNQFKAVYNADLASYRQIVLTAFQQVEDYLAAVRILSKEINQAREAEKSSEEYVELETARYQTGIDPYVNLVIAQNTLLANQQSLATLHVQQMTASVQLIQALGGGWDATQLPTPKQVSEKLTKADTAIQQ